MAKSRRDDWFVGVQVNAISLLDDGIEPVLDLFQKEAAANAVIVTAHGFNPEVIDRPLEFPGHGERGSHHGAGGFFATPHPEFYRDVPLGDFRVREPVFSGFDVLERVLPAAHSRGMSAYVYVLETASTGGKARNVPGFPRLLEIDMLGRRGGLPCINNPGYRAWKLGIVEDLEKSYEIDGFLWGVERWGPLHRTLAGECPVCFCPHCRALARERSLDGERVLAGYRALASAVERWRADRRGSQTPLIELLRIVMQWPEVVRWESLWTERYLALHRELYGVAKWIAPERPFGLGLWHYYFINPLLRAEWDLSEFASSADFIRPILYHLVEGPRIDRYLTLLTEGPFRGFAGEELHAAFSRALGLKLPSLATIGAEGLPGDYVRQGVEIVRREVGESMPIYAGIGVDVVQEGFSRRMQPDDVVQAVAAAGEAGADGITVSRNYAEMHVANLKAVGQALRSAGRPQTS